MVEIGKQILMRPVQLADQISKEAKEANRFRPECLELQTKAKKLADLIRQAARSSNDFCEQPTRRIIDKTEQVLIKALGLVNKCRTRSLVKRVFTIIPNAAFRKMRSQLDTAIADVTWLLRVSGTRTDDDEADIGCLGLPPIAQNEPILCLIWEQIANLSSGCLDDKADAAAQLVSLARDNDHYSRLIIEEGGLGPLLKLAKEGGASEGQENVARVIGLLGRDQESVEAIVNAGVASVFAQILRDGKMNVQAVVAWAVSRLAANYPVCQDHFAQTNLIRLLVSHLAFETIQEHTKYAIVKRHSNPNLNQSQSQSQPLLVGDGEIEDPETKAEMKAMAARALWHLAKGNISICKSMTESKALLCFAVLLDKGPNEVRYNSAMALMEITTMAEENTDFRRTAFKPTSPAAKAVVDQLIKVVTEANSEALLVPCIKSLGNLARTFRATETRVIEPLVKLLDDLDTQLTLEALTTLIKFACPGNFLHVTHSKSIIAAAGVEHLVDLVHFGERIVQIPALILLCYVARHVPGSREMAQGEVLIVFEWATKQGHIVIDPPVHEILLDAKSRLEIYQSRGSRF